MKENSETGYSFEKKFLNRLKIKRFGGHMSISNSSCTACPPADDELQMYWSVNKIKLYIILFLQSTVSLLQFDPGIYTCPMLE